VSININRNKTVPICNYLLSTLMLIHYSCKIIRQVIPVLAFGMIYTKKKRLVFLLTAVLCLQLLVFQPAQAAEDVPEQVKELNFVFIHGMGGTPCAFQALSDQIGELLPYFIARYQEEHPDITVKVNMFTRCYPGYVDIYTWAKNVTDDINEHFGDKDNLILVGHSMGGKTALFAAAHNIGFITDKVAAVITINSPIRNLDQYYVPGGGPMLDYCRTTMLGSDKGVCYSLAFYDSSEDGLKVGRDKHWLAFVSSEKAPLSPKYDRTGVDVWPRNMDDGIVPLSAQFSEGADVIYYGEYGHSDVSLVEKASQPLAMNILFYIFGYPVECSVLARSGALEHEADWLLGTDRWSDIVGGVATGNGTIEHTNLSFYKWQTWEDIVGECEEGAERSYSHVHLASLPVITGIKEARWVNPDNTSDCRLSISSSTAPLTTVKVEWTVFRSGLLPPEQERTFYDVEISRGTPFASISNVSWWQEDPLNPVIWIRSQAQSPFRWFEARWSIYQKEVRTIKVIDEIDLKIIAEED